MTLEAGEPTFSAVTAIICQQERRNADSLMSRCKTFAYGQAVLASGSRSRVRGRPASEHQRSVVLRHGGQSDGEAQRNLADATAE